MRLIDANTLKGEFTGNFVNEYPTALVHALIDSAPTIDAVQVVRCKDCYHSSEHPFIDNTIDCDKLDITVGEDFFCADGVRGLD